MTHSSFLAFKKLNEGGGHILVAARHNKRTIQAENGASSHIDVRRSRLNYSLAGESTPAEVNELAKRLMDDAGIVKLRKDAVRAIEVLFSLPLKTTIDHRDYFERCTRWAGERFGCENILSSDVHLDEACPHCHVLILPLRNGRMVGSEMVGGRAQLVATRKHFHDNVASLYGLSLEPRVRGADKVALADAVTKRLLSDDDPVTRSIVWQTVREAIASDPASFALALNVVQPTVTRKNKSVAAIFTGTGRKTSEDRKPIGFAPSKAPKPMLCRVQSLAPPVSVVMTESIRVRDSELASEQFDCETGEFIAPPSRSRLRGNRATVLTTDTPTQCDAA